jgi:hypothetical protein
VVLVDERTALAASRRLGETALLYRRDGQGLRFFARGRINAIEEPEGDRFGCRIKALARFDIPVDGAAEARAPGVRRMLTLTEERYAEIVEAGMAVADAALGAAEAVSSFDAERAPVDAYLAVRAEVLRRWNYCCAITDMQFARGEAPELRLVPIRPREQGGPLHASNYLPMVEIAERAWLTGSIAVTDDLEFVAVMDRLDPDLLAAMPPDGKLLVPADPALRPDAEHLAYHRTYVFGS